MLGSRPTLSSQRAPNAGDEHDDDARLAQIIDYASVGLTRPPAPAPTSTLSPSMAVVGARWPPEASSIDELRVGRSGGSPIYMRAPRR
jgi:hypothetical protein